jgi:topoisomerase-4 subunit A
MARGKGVRMQRYKDGGVADAKTFAMKDGLTWIDASGRTFTVAKAELVEWIGHRAEAGRLPPRGFPKNNRFG